MAAQAGLWLTVALGVALSCAALGCDFEPAKSSASLTYTEDAFKAYREAKQAFDDEDWEDARALMEEVKRTFSYSRYARLAELRLADIDFEQGKYSEAVASYRGFVKGHRADSNVEYARYRLAKSLYLDISDTVLLPPAEERDQANARDAFRELSSFARRFPLSRYHLDAGYLLEVVRQRLARHELYVARYYLREDNFVAAVARVDHALEHYSGSGLDAEALVLKGETLLKMHKPAVARRVFQGVIRDHGGPFAHIAQRFLDSMGAKAGADEVKQGRAGEG